MKVRLGAALCGVTTVFAATSVTLVDAVITPDAVVAATTNSQEPQPASPQQVEPNPAAFRTVLAALADDDRKVPAKGATVQGTASTYNPFKPGPYEGGRQTASGEMYDPNAWTAAIQMDLRDNFGGVRYGKDYRPTYALVERDDKQAIVKINDVGPLRPGRVIDFNEQTMRYFDPTLARGLIPGVKVTPLLGDDWPTGPIENDS
jgi:rare lipoprotein A